MKKHIVSVLLLLALLVPTVSFAQSGDVDPNPSSNECVMINSNMRYQMRDAQTNGEVSTLQDFLQSKGYLNSEPTGYFGLMTVAAVKSYQVANGIQGTGYVGPMTRAKIGADTCSGGTSNGSGSGTTMCTMEAKQCPDGSYVGRSGPRCEFARCGDGGVDARGCRPGSVYSTTTGERCNDSNLPAGCATSSGYSSTTGEPCTRTNNSNPVKVDLFGNEKDALRITSGDQVNLRWISSNANYCVGPNGSIHYGSANLSPAGYILVNPTETSTYTITCYKNGLGSESDSDSVTVTVESNNGIYPAGCSSGVGFSSTTGEPCTPSSTSSQKPVINSFTTATGAPARAGDGVDIFGANFTQAAEVLLSASVLVEADFISSNHIFFIFPSTIPAGQAQLEVRLHRNDGYYTRNDISNAVIMMVGSLSNLRAGCASTSGFSSVDGSSCGAGNSDGENR